MTKTIAQMRNVGEIVANDKELPSVERSLKYMAWDVKELSQSVKALVTMLQDKVTNSIASVPLDQKRQELDPGPELPF